MRRSESLFAKIKGNVAMSNHVLNLTSHRKHKQGNKIDQKYRPEDGDIKGIKEGRPDSIEQTFKQTPPKLELWQSTNERTKLVICISRQ